MTVAALDVPAQSEKDASGVSIRPSFGRAFRGLWHLTWKSHLTLRRLPLLLGTLGAIPVLAGATIQAGTTKPFIHWTVDFYFLLLLPLYCLAVCGAMIRDELQTDTLGFLITRPLARARLFLAKFLCHVIWLQALALLSSLLLFAVGLVRSVPGAGALVPIFLASQLLAVLAYGALSALLGLINQRYMVLGIIYGFVVELGIGQIPTNVNNLSLSRHLRTLLAHDQTIRDLRDWTPDKSLLSVAALLVAAVVFLAAGAALFTYREYHHSEEMQK